MDVQLVGFRVGSEYYAVNILPVVQIISPREPVKVAQAPPFVEGVIRLRSLVIPIVDLRRRFDVEVSEQRTNRIIVMRLACAPGAGAGSRPDSGESTQHLGLVVDEVMQVIRTQTEEFLRAPHIFTEGDAAYSGEVYQDAAQKRLYMVLDIGRILTPVEKRQLESELSPVQDSV